MPSLTSQDKVNISDYMSSILLRDLFDEALIPRQGTLANEQTAAGIAGILAGIPGFGTVVVSVLISASAIALLRSIVTATSIDTIRNQEDESYWLEVKRQIHCTLLDSYTDPAWLRERLARSIENIVPFNNRSSLKLRTQANAVVAQALRTLEPAAFETALDYAKTCWNGNTNGIQVCDDACIPNLALIPVDHLGKLGSVDILA
jgi:hypothetical protein